MAANTANKNDEVLGIKGFKESKHYEQVRPDYPREGVELLLNKLGLLGENSDKTRQLTVLELGAGTGKFTRVMAEVLQNANVRIIASDPVKEMCEQFKEMQPDIEIRQFGAEDIDLPDNSVDGIVVAGAFHWFAFDTSLDRIHQVLSPGGRFGVCWLFPSSQTSWTKSIADYLAPLYEQNSIKWPWLYSEQIFNDISSSAKFSKGEILPNFAKEKKLSAQQVYSLFCSYSVVSSSSDEKKLEFKTFFDNMIEKHFLATNEKELTVTYTCPMAWFRKIN